jgi:hypothetical protein
MHPLHKLFRQDFQRHIPIQLRVGGSVDLTHATLADFLYHSVVGKSLANHPVAPLKQEGEKMFLKC